MRARRFVAAVLVVVFATAPSSVVASNAERELGRRFLLEARSQLPMEDDPAVNELLRGLGNQLVAKLGPQEFDYRFFVIEHPTLNAFAVPGGYIFFFSGLIGRANSDDELAGVLGHEISHVNAHHMARQQTAGQLWTAAALLGMLASLVNPVLGAAGMAAAQTAQLKYSRDYEQEADYLGLGLVSKAGYDPHALASFFQELLTEQRLNPAGVPPYMLSHPVTQDRVAKVETIITAQHLSTPSGRPNRSLGLQEAQAVIRAQNGPKEEILAEYRRAAAASPKDPVAHFLLGRAYQSVGQTDAARVALEESHRLGGAEGREQRALGAVYLTANRPEDAKKAFDAYLARYPRDAWSHLMFGRAEAASGDETAAIQEYRRALTLDPESGSAHRELGLALGRQGKEADGFYHLAIAAREHGDLQQSWGFFQRAAAALPKDDPRQKEIQEALEELKPLVRDTREMPGQPQRQRGPLPLQWGQP